MKDQDPYVALARASIEQFVTTGRESAPPKNLPEALLNSRAGAFVSLHRGGQLRGCIGTLGPTAPTLAEEIWHNAVQAAAYDPRFMPLTPGELADLEVKVDVLKAPEPIQTLDELDVRRYGVIVSAGGRRGLLLPDLDGVDTPEDQVDIARQKAGIPAGTPLTLERFEVVRHT